MFRDNPVSVTVCTLQSAFPQVDVRNRLHVLMWQFLFYVMCLAVFGFLRQGLLV